MAHTGQRPVTQPEKPTRSSVTVPATGPNPASFSNLGSDLETLASQGVRAVRRGGFSRGMVPLAGMTAVSEFTLNDANAKPVSLAKWQSRIQLVVNTASKCGFRCIGGEARGARIVRPDRDRMDQTQFLIYRSGRWPVALP